MVFVKRDDQLYTMKNKRINTKILQIVNNLCILNKIEIFKIYYIYKTKSAGSYLCVCKSSNKQPLQLVGERPKKSRRPHGW